MSVNMSVAKLATRRQAFRPTRNSTGLYGSRPRRRALNHRELHVEKLCSITDLQSALSVSRSTVYRFIDRHHIPVVYVLGAPRIRESDVEHALESANGGKR
jgi:excisionase family DNA binding protein